MNFEEELTLRTELVNETIKAYLPAEEGFQKILAEAMNYSIHAGGKRIRPLLLMETYRLFDGRGELPGPFMAAIEMIHTFSLIHDDLPCMDNDVLRRGKPSTWAKFGEAVGVLSGDALAIFAFETATKAFSLMPNAVNVGEALHVLAQKSGIYGMTGGQTVDVIKTGQPLSKKELSFIYRMKTAALIEASMLIGAILANASKEDLETVEKVATRIGVAFQIQDDILDVTSSNEELGKPVHSDETNQKTTYVSLFGLDKARENVARYSFEAIELLHSLPYSNEFLTELIRYLMERGK